MSQSTVFTYVGMGLPGLNQYLARINGGDDKGSRLNRCNHDLRSFVMARSQLTGRKVSLGVALDRGN